MRYNYQYNKGTSAPTNPFTGGFSTSTPTVSSFTSSVFSHEDESYCQKLKEIEQHYLDTLLDGDRAVEESAYTEDSYFPLESSSKSQYSFLNEYTKYQAMYSNASDGTSKKRPMEVTMNALYNNDTEHRPLTVENLQKLADTPVVTSQANPFLIHKTTNVPETAPVNKQLYKTELCETFTTKGFCKYGTKCQFAHGFNELNMKERSNNFRTKPCINWDTLGYCPYGKRCCFKHGSNRDIELYVKAGILKITSADANVESQQPRKKNLHNRIKELQKFSW